MSLRYTLVSAAEIDGSLTDAWRCIQLAEGQFSSPYFSPEFTQCVASVRKDVQVVVIEDGGRAVGFFPHQRSPKGFGRPVAGAMSDFHGVVFRSGVDWSLPSVLSAGRLAGYTFDHLLAGNFPEQVVLRLKRAVSPQMDLSLGYGSYVAARRKQGSDYIPKTEGLARKLQREVGEIQFSYHDSRELVLDQLLAWKRQQYRQSGIFDVFSVEWTAELLRRVSMQQSKNFSGVCSVLRVDDKIIAVHVGMRSATNLHYWFPVYDPTYAKFSPGIILLLRMASSASEVGVQCIDLGKGDALYKDRLKSGSIDLVEGQVTSSNFTGQLMRCRALMSDASDVGGAGRLFDLPLRAVNRWERRYRFS